MSCPQDGVSSEGFRMTLLPATIAGIDLAERDRQRIVPRSDDADDAVGLEAEPAGLGLDRKIVMRDALVGKQLRSVARVVFCGLERNEDVGEERLDVRLAGFVGYRSGQIEAARVEDFAEPPDGGAARRERLGRPKGLGTPRASQNLREFSWQGCSPRGRRPGLLQDLWIGLWFEIRRGRPTVRHSTAIRSLRALALAQSGYSTESKQRPWAGAVGPERARSRSSSSWGISPGWKRPRPTSSSAPTILRTMCRRKDFPRTA